jgi:hypothetical protein
MQRGTTSEPNTPSTLFWRPQFEGLELTVVLALVVLALPLPLLTPNEQSARPKGSTTVHHVHPDVGYWLVLDGPMLHNVDSGECVCHDW